MASDEREQMRREEVLTRLEDARRLIEPPLRQRVQFHLVRFADFARDGKLEAAWDALYEAGEELDVPARFWRALAEAASLLKLEERRAEASAHAARAE